MDPIAVDANDVVDELTKTIASMHRQIAILTVQLRNATATPTEVAPEA